MHVKHQKHYYAIVFSVESISVANQKGYNNREVLMRRRIEETEKVLKKQRPVTGFKHVRLFCDNVPVHTSVIVPNF